MLPVGGTHEETDQHLKKLGSTPFIYALAKVLKVAPDVVTKLKTRHGLIGSEDFSFWSRLSEDEQARVVREMVADEALDEVVAVVVARLQSQRQGLA